MTTRADAERCATFMKALSDPTRLRIVQALRQGEWTVSDLANLVEMDLAIVSHHVRVLYHAGITSDRRDGKYVYYSLKPCIVGSKQSLDFGCCRLDMPVQQ